MVHRRGTKVRLSITVDPELLEEVRRLAKVRTKREAIERALKAFVRQHRLQELQALAGSGVVEMELEELRRWRQSSSEQP
jgi:Arc/MetJ family transcription regulator